MSLANVLNTNEVKNAAGVEVEFTRVDTVGRKTVFAQVGEPPAKPYRLTVAHQEVGNGMKRRRRSVVRFDKTVISDVDNTTPVTVTGYVVLDAPVGALNANTEMSNVLANVWSFCATTGAATTVLFDNTGNGGRELLAGGL